ncbi:MAG: tetratricopeptide repeat protein [Proteobacteria bacterium]|nr:tetratricopeptide repeat protein [Pseudomonadota bacterium]
MALTLLWVVFCRAPAPAASQLTDKDLDPGVKMNFLIMEGGYFRIEPEQYLSEGIQASIVENHRYAVYLLTKAIDSGGLSLDNLSRAYVARGISNRALGDQKAAIHDLAKALEAVPSSATAHYQLAETLRAMGKTTEAIIALNQAIALKPNYAQAYYLRGSIWMQRGDNRLAAKDFSQCIAYDSSLAKAFLQRGKAQRKLGNTSEALADFNEFSLRNPLDEHVKELIRQLKNQKPKGEG